MTIGLLHSCFQDLQSANDSVCALIEDEMERRADQNNWYEPRFMNIAFFLKEVEAWKVKEQLRLQATIEPRDSISIVSGTSRTSIASATKIAAAEKAALEARAKALPAIHAMEMEEAALKSKTAALKSRRETIELQSEIEAVDAKLKALSLSEVQGDAMNEYYDTGTFSVAQQ